MNLFNDEELIRRLKRLNAVQPAPAAMNQALDRVRQSLVKDSSNKPRWGNKIVLKHVAAAAAVLIVVGGTLVWFWPASSPAQASFGELQQVMKAVRSVTCRQTTRGGDEPAQTTQWMFLADGRARFENSDGSSSILDPTKARMLILNPKKREAKLWLGIKTPPVNPYELFKNLPNDASARRLPGKKIDGKEVLGFAVKVVGEEATLWADARTRLPLRIEAEQKGEQGKTITSVLDDFIFDRELDPKLFSMEPPAGYKVDTLGVAELPPPPADPKLKDLVVTPWVGIGPVKFGMSREEIENLFGRADAVVEGKNNVDLNYGSRGFTLGVRKNVGLWTIWCKTQEFSLPFRINDFSGKTDKGIAMGASKADIMRVYGKPDAENIIQTTTQLAYREPDVSFTIVNDKLIQMNFMYQRREAK